MSLEDLLSSSHEKSNNSSVEGNNILKRSLNNELSIHDHNYTSNQSSQSKTGLISNYQKSNEAISD